MLIIKYNEYYILIKNPIMLNIWDNELLIKPDNVKYIRL
jgi:hypothetical protein